MRLEDSRVCKSTCYSASYLEGILFEGYFWKYSEEDLAYGVNALF